MPVSKRPKLFQNPTATGNKLKQTAENDLINYAVKSIQQLNRSVPMNQKLNIQQAMPNYLVITERRAIKHGVVDLKPLFANSPNKKYSKKGGWYLIIPIRRKVSSMSHALYQEARSAIIPVDSNSVTFSANHLFDNRPQASIASINYQPVSDNLTKLRTGSNRSNYIAFRTVSSSSPPSSWIVGRQNVNEQDMSQTLLKNLDRMMKWKLRNMN